MPTQLPRSCAGSQYGNALSRGLKGQGRYQSASPVWAIYMSSVATTNVSSILTKSVTNLLPPTLLLLPLLNCWPTATCHPENENNNNNNNIIVWLLRVVVVAHSRSLRALYHAERIPPDSITRSQRSFHTQMQLRGKVQNGKVKKM